MAWVLLDDNFPHHPKVLDAGRDAGWLYVCGLAYCRKYHTQGVIPRAALAKLGAGLQPRKLVDALVRVGLWDQTDNGFQVHDYSVIYADDIDKAEKDEHQQDRAELRRIRQEAGRKGGLAKRVANAKQNAPFATPQDGMVRSGECSSKLLEEKKREADFAAFWQAYPKKDGKQKAREAWAKLRPTDDMQKQIASDLERRKRSSQWLKEGGQFIPHASTYLNQRRFEDGFSEGPRLAEKTVNVLKGWEDPNQTEVA